MNFNFDQFAWDHFFRVVQTSDRPSRDETTLIFEAINFCDNEWLEKLKVAPSQGTTTTTTTTTTTLFQASFCPGFSLSVFAIPCFLKTFHSIHPRVSVHKLPINYFASWSLVLIASWRATSYVVELHYSALPVCIVPSMAPSLTHVPQSFIEGSNLEGA